MRIEHRGGKPASPCSCGGFHDEQGSHKLIASVTASKSTVSVNESVYVQVKLLRSREAATVKINEAEGAAQWLQIPGPPGVRKIQITAVGLAEHCSESRTLSITVVEPPCCTVFPLIQVSRGPLDGAESSIAFEVANYKDLANADGSALEYAWNFGVAGKLTSRSPNGAVTKSFEDSLDPNEPKTSFHVTVAVSLVQARSVTARKTISVWNLYFVNKMHGRIMPKAVYNLKAVKDADEILVAKSTIHNAEKEPLRLELKLVEYLLNDLDEPRQFGSTMRIDPIIGPLSDLDVDCSIPASTVPRNAYGYAIHFSGHGLKSGTAVHVSCYFEHKEPEIAVIIKDPASIRILHDLRNNPLYAGRTRFTHSHLLGYAENIRDPIRNRLLQPLFNKVLSGPAPGNDTLSPPPNIPLPDLLAGYGPNEKDKCLPDQEPAEDDLACQLQTEFEWVYIPPRIVNACKGDTILSPGGMGPIGILLRALLPSQMYAHCGIMTKNYYELTNSTASEEWMLTHLAGLKGSEGIDPTALKYVWPGVVTQTVGEQFEGVSVADSISVTGTIQDPDGNQRELKPFDYRGVPGQQDSIAEAMVVKPDPMLEAAQPSLRSTLHQVAEIAKATKSHYRFFAFTDASISMNRTQDAPTNAAPWLTLKPQPTCCSSLIWAAMKSLNSPKIQLEGPEEFTRPGDLEPSDTSSRVDAHVDSQTLDGLYRYSHDNRVRAADALYGNVADKVEKKLRDEFGSFGGGVIGLFTDAKDDAANQVCNTFAFDWSGENEFGDEAKDSDDWKQPGIGHAVSPDNILLWDAPKREEKSIQSGIYGYAEKMVYRPGYVEWRQVSRWVRVKKKGTIKGTVAFQSVPVANANVSIAGQALVCNNEGKFTVEVLAGMYSVAAGKLWTDGLYYQCAISTTVVAGQETSLIVNLDPPPAAFREVAINGTVRILDSDTWSDNPSPPFNWIVSGLYFGEYYNQGTHREHTFVRGWADEVRVELHVSMDLLDGGAIRVNWEGKLFEGDSVDTNDLDDSKSGTFDMARDTWTDFTLHLENRDFGGGDTGGHCVALLEQHKAVRMAEECQVVVVKLCRARLFSFLWKFGIQFML